VVVDLDDTHCALWLRRDADDATRWTIAADALTEADLPYAVTWDA
jgi:hypothetical protein